MNEQNTEQNQEAGACGPGCNCGPTGVSSRIKWVICGLVALAAVGVVAAHVSRTRATSSQANSQSYAATVSSLGDVDMAKSTQVADSEAWTSPLKALVDLNQVAVDTDAVFVVLPSNDADRTAAIQKEVMAAAATITARGSRMGKFLLSQDSQEYAELSRQVGTPAVLALCKGRGMAAVSDKDVTQGNLLKAFVSASRPASGCCPGGGGSSSGCR